MRHPCQNSPDCLHEVCQDCNRPIRLYKQPLSEHPGSIPGILWRKLCHTHLNKRKPKPLLSKPQLEQVNHEATVRGLENFMRRIRGKSRV